MIRGRRRIRPTPGAGAGRADPAGTRKVPCGGRPGRQKWTLLGDHHLLDHPSHCRAGGDGFTAETAETAEEHAQETTASASGSRPPDPPTRPPGSGPISAVSAISAVNLGSPSRLSPRSGPWYHGGDRRDVSKNAPAGRGRLKGMKRRHVQPVLILPEDFLVG